MFENFSLFKRTSELESKIDYNFQDKSILLQALTHKSVKNQSSYEVLEL